LVAAILKLRLMAMVMAGWASASSPVPLPATATAYATIASGRAVEPVSVKLYDENMHQSATVAIARDGTMDRATTAQLQRLFRCRTTLHEHPIARATLVMLADLADRFPDRTIEYVSVFRTGAGESSTSPHRAGRAIDFRIRGESLLAIRDYLWRTYSSVGIGWYPGEQFIHMDARPGEKEIAWTFAGGDNHYHPGWADRARATQPATTRTDHRPGS